MPTRRYTSCRCHSFILYLSYWPNDIYRSALSLLILAQKGQSFSYFRGNKKNDVNTRLRKFDWLSNLLVKPFPVCDWTANDMSCKWHVGTNGKMHKKDICGSGVSCLGFDEFGYQIAKTRYRVFLTVYVSGDESAVEREYKPICHVKCTWMLVRACC